VTGASASAGCLCSKHTKFLKGAIFRLQCFVRLKIHKVYFRLGLDLPMGTAEGACHAPPGIQIDWEGDDPVSYFV